jgi:hypothetical protein
MSTFVIYNYQKELKKAKENYLKILHKGLKKWKITSIF